MTADANRTDGLDILKCICAFMIVCIHSPFPGRLGQAVTAVGRFGVPVFFMITGYFYMSLIQKNRIKAHIKKLVLIFLITGAVYAVYSLVFCYQNGTLFSYLESLFTPKRLLKFILLNDPLFGFHLWYLLAVLYVLIGVEIIRKLFERWKQIFYIAGSLLLLCNLVLGKYSIVLFGRQTVPHLVLRNFLFFGVPFFSVGLFLSEHKSILSKAYRHMRLNILLVVLFMGTTVIELYLLTRAQVNADSDFFLSSVLLSVSVFVLFSNPLFNRIKPAALKTIGKRYSMMIYLFHPLIAILYKAVIKALYLAAEKAGFIKYLYCYSLPFAVFLLSLLFSIIYSFVAGKIREHNDMRRFLREKSQS